MGLPLHIDELEDVGELGLKELSNLAGPHGQVDLEYHVASVQNLKVQIKFVE